MLSEERHKLILEKVKNESVVYLNDLVKYLNTSESTIRRDLIALDNAGLLKGSWRSYSIKGYKYKYIR